MESAQADFLLSLWLTFLEHARANPGSLLIAAIVILAVETLGDLWIPFPFVAKLATAASVIGCGVALEANGCRVGGPIVYLTGIGTLWPLFKRPRQPIKKDERMPHRFRWNILPAALIALSWVVLDWCR